MIVFHYRMALSSDLDWLTFGYQLPAFALVAIDKVLLEVRPASALVAVDKAEFS